MIKKIFAPAKNSDSANFALLVLRLWIGFEMLLVHGLDKFQNFKQVAPNFPDPFGIGHTASLALSVFAEFFVSMLIILGLERAGADHQHDGRFHWRPQGGIERTTGRRTGVPLFAGLRRVVACRAGPLFCGQAFVRQKSGWQVALNRRKISRIFTITTRVRALRRGETFLQSDATIKSNVSYSLRLSIES